MGENQAKVGLEGFQSTTFEQSAGNDAFLMSPNVLDRALAAARDQFTLVH